MKTEDLRQHVINWASDKNITDPIKQTLKTLSEAGELADAVCKSNLDKVDHSKIDILEVHNSGDIIDAIGDVEVCLTILKHQLGLNQNGCLEAAWAEIKDRKGKTENGTFVKNS